MHVCVCVYAWGVGEEGRGGRGLSVPSRGTIQKLVITELGHEPWSPASSSSPPVLPALPCVTHVHSIKGSLAPSFWLGLINERHWQETGGEEKHGSGYSPSFPVGILGHCVP